MVHASPLVLGRPATTVNQELSMCCVSVIMATYNHGMFIREAIESALAQSVRAKEIIVVDDGSTDGTESVVEPFVQWGVRYVRQSRQGVSSARNHGMTLATGEYLAFLDSDDRWNPTNLESLLTIMEADAGLCCCFGNFERFVNGTGEILGDQFQYFRELEQTASKELGDGGAKVIDGIAFPSIVGWSDFPAFMLTMLFRRSAINGLRFDSRLTRCQDAAFVLRACMRGRIAYTGEILAQVRRHERNATRDFDLLALDKLKALQVVSEDALAGEWNHVLSERLIRARFDAANALLRRRRWREASGHIVSALSSSGSPVRKIRGALRAGVIALSHAAS